MPNPGDYFVVATPGFAARVIRVATRSPWNHSGIYKGNGTIIEADPSRPIRGGKTGVQYADVSKYDGCKILWSNLQLPPERAAVVITAAEAQLGLEYGWLDVAAIGLSTIGIVTAKLDDPDSRFCSQVSAISENADRLLCDKAVNRITPGDLANIINHQPVPANW